jgi:hypothetical protein
MIVSNGTADSLIINPPSKDGGEQTGVEDITAKLQGLKLAPTSSTAVDLPSIRSSFLWSQDQPRTGPINSKRRSSRRSHRRYKDALTQQTQTLTSSVATESNAITTSQKNVTYSK